MAGPPSQLRVDSQPPVSTITMDNSRRRNALSVEMMGALITELERQATKDDVSVLVLRAEGPAFSAGHDLSELLDRSLDEEREVFETCNRLMAAIQSVPQPVIAAVKGVATAAGCQLVASCDLAVAADSAVFATPGVKIGLFCSTPMVAVTRNVGRKRAMEMLLTGRPITAQTALEWGLVNRVVPADELDAAALSLALEIAAASPLTLRIGKRAFYRQVDVDQSTAYSRMSETMAENAVSADAQEGMGAFLQKRQPVWRGR